MKSLILVINPGSTSTKIAVFEGRKQVFLINIKHSLESLNKFARIADQFVFRKETIEKALGEASIELKSIRIIVGRGGLLKPIEGGVYCVNEAMLRDIRNPMGEHESNLGGLIAHALAKEIGNSCQAIIADPTCVDEMEEIARISGMPELPRRSFLHTLNQRAVARKYALEIGKKYEEMNIIVAHMGGGISIGMHKQGRIVDVNNGLNGDGPMSPERSGGLPVGQLVELCFSGKYTKPEILKKIKGQGGLIAYLGTNDNIEIENRIEEGDNQAKLVHRAMTYQVAKEIGGLSTIVCGKVDVIILTGGLAYSKQIISDIISRVEFIAPVKVYPGEGEMEAMAMYGEMVLKNEIEVKEYV
ncbi:MAG: butyrate kinase [Bacteroidetes bacterium]|nr:butyrate kinase [Bacteroidota bacterium]